MNEPTLIDLDEEWQIEQASFRGVLDRFSVATQLFIEQAKTKGFGVSEVIEDE